jgi:hypothetical protein
MTVDMASWNVVIYNLLKTEDRAVPVLNHEDMWEDKRYCPVVLNFSIRRSSKVSFQQHSLYCQGKEPRLAVGLHKTEKSFPLTQINAK